MHIAAATEVNSKLVPSLKTLLTSLELKVNLREKVVVVIQTMILCLFFLKKSIFSYANLDFLYNSIGCQFHFCDGGSRIYCFKTSLI